MRKITLLTGFFLSMVLFFSPGPVQAAGEFQSSYNVTYDIGDSGETLVTEQITLKNLTDRYFAESFTLTISATELAEITAFDSSGPLDVTSKDLGNKAEITVKFNKQIVGKNKEYPWTLRFKSNDFAQKQGQVWQVSVPKISNESEVGNYTLILQVPVSFGDPSTIIPEPVSQSEVGGKLQFKFGKDQLKDSGILANFGNQQLFDFNLSYTMTNNSILPALGSIPLPPDTNYQQVVIKSIEPKPENVTVDKDGNYIAWFKVDRRQSLEVRVSGLAKIYINNLNEEETLTDEERKIYTSEQTFWDITSPAIKTRLSEIFAESDAKTNRQKAQAINRFVVSLLEYDETRLEDKNFERLGAVTALANPERALCSEFTDLFIALARAAGIPARQLAGYAYTSNTDLRPLSLDDNVLHTWPEYFDEEEGWIMIDPTWENTTGGVDYFSKFDLNHFVMAIRGTSSQEPYLPDSVDVKFSEGKFQPAAKLSLLIDAPTEIFAGFPSPAFIKIANLGNQAVGEQDVSFSSSKIEVNGTKSFRVPTLPPYGSFEYKYNLKSGLPFESYEDILKLKVGDEEITKRVLIKPFFHHKYFSFAVGSITVLITAAYLVTLALHLRYVKRLRK